MSKQGSIHFSKKEVEYLIKKTGEEDAQKAVELFASIIRSEGIDALKMMAYVKALMELDKVR